MNSNLSMRYLLLDFDHPMSFYTVNLIENSLQNVLALATASKTSKSYTLGISVINSDFKIIQSSTYLHKDYCTMTQKLGSLHTKFKENNKTTVQEYSNSLQISLKNIFLECNLKYETRNFHQEKISLNNPNTMDLQITLITKKTASFLGKILLHMTNEYLDFVKKIKIIQILNEETNICTSEMNLHIECLTISNTLHHLNCFLKEWIFKSSLEPERLQVILFNNIGVNVKCETDDCILNPASLPFREIFDLFGEAPIIIKNKEIRTQTYNLEILHRIPTSGVCPKLIFGIPHRIIATRASTLSQNESYLNLKIFKEMCRQLAQTEQGLLTSFKFDYCTNGIVAYYFITSDGETLLLNSITPEELFLCKYQKFVKPDFYNDKNVVSKVKNFLQHIQLLEEYLPTKFSSGLYEALRNYFLQTAKQTTLCGLYNLKLKNKKTTTLFTEKFEIKRNKIKFPQNQVLKTEYLKKKQKKYAIKKYTLENTVSSNMRKKRQIFYPKLESTNVHPALLSPKTAERYRKVHSSAFDLPELSQAYLP